MGGGGGGGGELYMENAFKCSLNSRVSEKDLHFAYSKLKCASFNFFFYGACKMQWRLIDYAYLN